MRRDMPHERLQEFVIINYAEEISIQAMIQKDAKEEIVGIGRFFLDARTHTAEVAFMVKDTFQNRGIGTELLNYLIFLARKRGLIGLTAELLTENRPMHHVFDKAGFKVFKTEDNMIFMNLALSDQFSAN